MRPSISAAIFVSSLIFIPVLHAQDASDYKSNPKFISAMADAK
jgi:hypothetical protein